MSRLIDWKNVCLVCLKNGENRSIFERDADSNVIVDKIMKCADIFIEQNANQPKSICLQCHYNLNVTCKFHRNYKQSDSIIKALLTTTHQEFKIKDLWKTNPFGGAQEKQSRQNEIFHIEEAANSNEINIKHEIVENNVVDDNLDNDNSPCVYLEANIDSGAKFVLKGPAETCFRGTAIQQNDVKTNEGNKIKQDANDEMQTRLRSQSKTSIENSCDKPTRKTVYKKALKICEICNLGFKYQSRLTIHMRLHNNERPFSCDRCDKAYARSGELRRHMTAHTGEKPYECQYCDHRFTLKGNRNDHERTHTGERPYQCQYCDRRFTLKCNRKRHERTHTGEKPYKCQYCDSRFAENNNRKAHERTHTGERPFVCPTCGKSFAYSHVLAEHRLIHTAVNKFICEKCGKAFDKRLILERHVAHHLSLDKLGKSSENKQKKVLEKEIFQIKECAKSNEINIKHEIIENDVVDESHDNNSPCIDLGDNIDSEAIFAPQDPAEACFQDGDIQQNDLEASEGNKIKQDANDEIPTRLRSESKTSIENSCDKQSPKSVNKKGLKICEICNRGFKYQYKFTIHMRRHNNERPFSCDRCDKAYVRSVELRVHMRAHTGEKPYKCQYCDSRFTEKSYQKSHERTHTGEKPYKCQYCDSRFAEMSNRKNHERTHTGERPYQCQYCHRRFTRKSSQEKHQRTHTGERPFVCPTCGESFADSEVLTKHRRNHTDVRKFICEECGKVFDKRLHLERHIRRHPTRGKLDKSSDHKQKTLLGKEISQIEENDNSNDINIKHEEIS